MKSLFQTKPGALLTIALLVAISAVTANAQEPSRLQLSSLDHLAAKASQTVDVNIDERLIRVALPNLCATSRWLSINRHTVRWEIVSSRATWATVKNLSWWASCAVAALGMPRNLVSQYFCCLKRSQFFAHSSSPPHANSSTKSCKLASGNRVAEALQ